MLCLGGRLSQNFVRCRGSLFGLLLFQNRSKRCCCFALLNRLVDTARNRVTTPASAIVKFSAIATSSSSYYYNIIKIITSTIIYFVITVPRLQDYNIIIIIIYCLQTKIDTGYFHSKLQDKIVINFSRHPTLAEKCCAMLVVVVVV